MNVFMSPTQKIQHQILETQNLDAKFRRATLNMIASTFVCEDTLNKYNPLKNGRLGFIYATHFGEIDSSTQYLSFLHTEKFGRPIFFQNSLHNSTLGFVTIHLQIKGPSLTISGGKFMNESILNSTQGLLSICDHVLVCMSESIPDKYIEIYAESFPAATPWFNQSLAFLISKERMSDSEQVDLAKLKLI